ncbi:MAG: hypothetical protein DWQ01_10870 [Planctomycetota bacterium]|nr:MAG: hypothetical protein DWQ01_10870 [Planctomycetota bacterium]
MRVQSLEFLFAVALLFSACVVPSKQIAGDHHSHFGVQSVLNLRQWRVDSQEFSLVKHIDEHGMIWLQPEIDGRVGLYSITIYRREDETKGRIGAPADSETLVFMNRGSRPWRGGTAVLYLEADGKFGVLPLGQWMQDWIESKAVQNSFSVPGDYRAVIRLAFKPGDWRLRERGGQVHEMKEIKIDVEFHLSGPKASPH